MKTPTDKPLLSTRRYFLYLGIYSVLLISLFVAVALLAFKIVDRFYFNQLIYHKSPWYGYVDPSLDWSRVASAPNLPPVVKKRVEDTTAMIEWQKQHAMGGNLIPSIDTRKRVRDQKRPFTILLIGDSVTFGTGVLTHQRFGNQLKKT